MAKSKLSATSFTFSEEEMPVRMGRYHLLARLARDPISEQFLAAWGVEQGIEQLRVVRCIYPRVAREAEFIGLFQEESRALSRLSSDNIARIMEVGVQGDIPFVAREYVEGITLDQVVELALKKTYLWPWELAAHVITELLRGLDYIHRREDIHGNPMGMRHGDVRLENLVLSYTGEVKLVNFGSMLRFIVDEATHAKLSRIRSSYLPPEGNEDVEPTVAGDLWAAAMILLVLLGGKVPSAHKTGWLPPKLSSRVENLPRVVDSFIAKALNPNAEYRFKTAAAMRSALVEIMGEFVSGHPPDDLAKWIESLGNHKKNEEQQLIRSMLGKPADMSLENTAQAATTLGPGYVLDSRYHLLRELGEGGMGTVFEAEHVGLNKRCAVKVLHERVLADNNTVERFKREARIIGNIGHPRIVGAQDFGVSERGYYFLAMDLLDGKPLSHRIWEANLSYWEIANIMVQVCEGLQAAHEADVIHRDLKPDNIHLTSKGARILDFGIAKSVGLDAATDALTRTGHICGTVDYIAPEQIRGSSDDPRSDIYAAGVIIYECLTGETPFHGRTVGEALHKAINDKLVTPSKRSGKKDIPTQLEAICVKALNRRAEKRFDSAKQLGDELQEVADKLEVREKRRLTQESKVNIAPVVSLLKRKQPLVIGAVVLVLASVGATLFLSFGNNNESHPRQPDVTKAYENLVIPSGQATTPIVVNNPAVPGPENRANVEPSDNASADAVSPEELDPAVPPDEDMGEIDDKEILAMVADLRRKEAAQGQSLDLAKKFAQSGNENLKKRAFDLAKKDFNEALRHNHRMSDAWFGLGKTAFAMGDYQNAIQKVNQSIKFSPSVKIAKRRNFLGMLYKANGNVDKAEGEWQKVLAMNPDDADAKRHLGRDAD